MSDPNEPEETLPFTHRPYGSGGDDNPFVSPSGPAAQPSGPGYTTPPPPPPTMTGPTTGPVPYGPPATGDTQQPWQAAWAPVYGAPMAGQDHRGATTSMTLGIVSMVCLVLAFFCCLTLPGVFCAPFAWWIGAKAKREIDAAPQVYGNRGAAQAGVVMGIIGTVLGALLLAGSVAIVAFIGITGFSLV